MLHIYLNNLRFHAHHGIYAEEKLLGNTFEVNAEIKIDANEKIKHLEQTTDYVKAYEIIKQRMAIATPLLETVADDIADLLYLSDKKVQSVFVKITKLNPPIQGIQGTVGIAVEKKF